MSGTVKKTEQDFHLFPESYDLLLHLSPSQFNSIMIAVSLQHSEQPQNKYNLDCTLIIICITRATRDSELYHGNRGVCKNPHLA